MYKFVSFDLDNTLYSYDTNSKKAVESVMDMLVSSVAGLDRQTLWDTYIDYIKKIPGPQLFSDGRTSYEYRKERFTDILGSFDIRDEELGERCVELYSEGLTADMKPYPDVTEVLEKLCGDHRVIIITDAPRDVQDRILEVLDIKRYVHRLFTPTTHGLIKEDGGLFKQALEELDAGPEDMIHIGDSYLRDVLGARKTGIRAVLIKREKGEITRLFNMPRVEDAAETIETIDTLDEVFRLL